MNKITVAGAGSGSFLHLTPEVKSAFEEADLIVANIRFLNLIPDKKKFIELKNFNEIFNRIEHENEKNILFLVSGDSGLYSLLPLLKKRFADIKVLPGLSSLQILCAHAGETWNDAKILSGHGRDLNKHAFLNIAERSEKIILFCDKNFSPKWVCEQLIDFTGVEVFIGSNLGSENEIFVRGRPADFVKENFPELSIILIKNNEIYIHKKNFLSDKDFLREKNIVMTNENVRSVIISKLELDDNSILWDIGAGSGSISISAAYENLSMEVHAMEKNPTAANLILRNAAKFHLHNINVYEGTASGFLDKIPVPSHIFIGGSGGELKKIFDFIIKLKNKIRIVIACVTLETFNKAYEFMKNMKNFEAVQISVTSSHTLNENLTLMKANNPVMILTCESCDTI